MKRNVVALNVSIVMNMTALGLASYAVHTYNELYEGYGVAYIPHVICNVLTIVTSGFMAHTIRTSQLQSLPAMSQFNGISKVQAATILQAIVLVIHTAPFVFILVSLVSFLKRYSRYGDAVDTFDILFISLVVVGFLGIAVDAFGNCSTN